MLAEEPAVRPSVQKLATRLEECRRRLANRTMTARRLVFAGVLAAAVIALLLNRSPPANAPRAMLAGNSIAVFQFENQSEDKNDDYLARGVRGEIAAKLTRVRGLRVISRAVKTKYDGRSAALRELGRELDAAYFLSGRVKKTAEAISIEVQLIEGQTGAQLWSESYKHSLAEASGVEGRVAQKVADALQITLAPSDAQRLRTAFTNNPRAHDLRLRAGALFANSDEQSHEQQIALLRDAVAEDPAYRSHGLISLERTSTWRTRIALRAKSCRLPEKPRFVPSNWITRCRRRTWSSVGSRCRPTGISRAANVSSSGRSRSMGTPPWLIAFTVGTSQRVERNFVAARQEMASARRTRPAQYLALVGGMGVAIAQGDYEGALRLAERVMEIDPEFLYDRRFDRPCLRCHGTLE